MLGCFQKSGDFTPKMDGLFHGKTLLKIHDLGGFVSLIFGNIHLFRSVKGNQFFYWETLSRRPTLTVTSMVTTIGIQSLGLAITSTL